MTLSRYLFLVALAAVGCRPATPSEPDPDASEAASAAREPAASSAVPSPSAPTAEAPPPAVARTWADPVRLDTHCSSFASPALTMNDRGAVTAVWLRPGDRLRDLYAASFDPRTGEWTDGEEIDSGSVSGGVPRLVTAADGSMVVAWQEEVINRSGRVTSTTVKARRFDPERSAWGPIETPRGRGRGHVEQGELDLAAGGDGSLVVVWTQFIETGAGPTRDHIGSIYASRFDPGAGTWGDPLELDRHAKDTGRFPRVAVDDDGNAIAVWYILARGPMFLEASRYDRSTGRWEAPVRLQHGAGGAWMPRIAFAGGEAYVSWQRSRAGPSDRTAEVTTFAAATSGDRDAHELSPDLRVAYARASSGATPVLAAFARRESAQLVLAAAEPKTSSWTDRVSEPLPDRAQPQVGALGVGPQADAWVLWTSGAAAPYEVGISHYETSADRWHPPVTLGQLAPERDSTGPDGTPKVALAVGSEGRVAVMWQDCAEATTGLHARVSR